MTAPEELTAASIAKLDIPEDAKRTLVEITAANADAWRATVSSLNAQVQRMLSMMERMQTTLSVLVEVIRPELKEKLPVAFSLASDANSADVASALLVADPIAAGFTLSQKALAERMGMTAPDVSVLVRAFCLDSDASCAVVVRRGEGKQVVNYHPNAAKRLEELIAAPPKGLKQNALAIVRRVRQRKGLAANSTGSTSGSR